MRLAFPFPSQLLLLDPAKSCPGSWPCERLPFPPQRLRVSSVELSAKHPSPSCVALAEPSPVEGTFTQRGKNNLRWRAKESETEILVRNDAARILDRAGSSDIEGRAG